MEVREDLMKKTHVAAGVSIAEHAIATNHTMPSSNPLSYLLVTDIEHLLVSSGVPASHWGLFDLVSFLSSDV